MLLEIDFELGQILNMTIIKCQSGGNESGLRLGIGFFFFAVSFVLYIAFSVAFPVDSLFSVINYSIVISALSWIFIFDRDPNSLRQIFFLCCIIFFAIAPRIEFSRGTVYWTGSQSVFNFYEITAVYALIGMWVFALSFAFGKRKRVRFRGRCRQIRKHYPVSEVRLVLLSATAVALIYYLNGFSVVNVLFRATSEANELARLSSSVSLIYNNSIRSFPSICFIVYMLFGGRRASIAIPLFLLMLIGNPITGFARWQGAMLYLAALLAVFPHLIRLPYFVTIFLFTGTFVIFPLLDLFRRFADDLRVSLTLGWISGGHLDSFQNFARVVEFEAITFGYQLVGVLLFFVPREFWPSKPVSSGVEVAQMANLEWNNIALNILGEGYINFGVPGVIFFAAALGFFCGQLDRAFWRDINFSRTFQTYYLFFLGGFVFVFRGSLLSAFAYLVGTYVAVWLVLLITERRRGRPRGALWP